MKPTKELSSAEETELAELEQSICNKYMALYGIAKDLKQIEEKQLYRSKYSTFNDYSQSKFDLPVQYIHEIIRVSGVLEDLCDLPFHQRPYPTNLTQIQEYYNLTGPERIRLARKVSEVLNQDQITPDFIHCIKRKMFPDKCKEMGINLVGNASYN